jgi:transcriptional regulator with XRE-family HTH domain
MAIIIRKLRLQRGWTQDQLAEFAGITVRTVQRVERGTEPSLETMKSLAAVFEVDITTLQEGATSMQPAEVLQTDESEALKYVKGIREFYMHLFMYAVFAIVFPAAFISKFGLDNPSVRMMLFALLGWGIGLVVHGLTAYEVIRFLGPKWERELIEKHLGRRL